MIFAFTGCSLFSADHPTALVGVLTEQAASDSYTGTHLLTVDDGTVYPLNSTILNLSSPQYLGNKVSVQLEYDKENDVYKVTGISVQEVLEKNGVAAKWTTYIHQGLGFKLKYYDNWDVKDNYVTGSLVTNPAVKPAVPASSISSSAAIASLDLSKDYVIFTAPLQGTYDNTLSATQVKLHDYVEVRKLENKVKSAFDKFIKDVFPKIVAAPYDSFIQSDAKVGPNQQNTKEFKTTNGNEVVFFMQREPNFVYVIHFNPLENANNNNQRTFYEMLLEFQFVPFADAMGKITPDIPVETPANSVVTPTPETSVTPETSSASETVIPATDSSLSTAKTYDYSTFSEFESFAYKFKAKYPTKWYYDGSLKSTEEGVLSKYALSDKPVTPENEFASLKLLSTKDLPSGSALTFPNGSGAKKYVGDRVYFYVKVGDKVFSVEGGKDKEEILEKIAGSITFIGTGN